MRFRPCIDIHNGKVKQIVGGSLRDEGDEAKENFVSEKDGDYYAKLYKELGLYGGHIILLNKEGTMYYEEDVKQALKALHAYPNGLQIGGGISPKNAKFFLEEGASHVIVTSYVFQNGVIHWGRLKELCAITSDEEGTHLVLDLSCRKKDGKYYIVTERWQTFTDIILTEDVLEQLSEYCDEFLIHGVDVEGKASGIEKELVALLGNWNKKPITYAGGIGSYKDLEQLKVVSKGTLDVTIGSALDLFGGTLEFKKVLDFCQ